jgi:hypothetical protein
LQYCLFNEPIEHGGDAEQSYSPSVRLRYFHPKDGGGVVLSAQ